MNADGSDGRAATTRPGTGRRPPLGALLQRADVRLPQGQAQRPVEQRGRLGLGKPKIIGPDLEHLTPRPQPSQRQLRVGPKGQGQPDGRGEVLDHESDRTEDVPVGDEVIVIECQRHRGRQDLQLVDQHGQDRVRAAGAGSREHRQGRRAEARRHARHAGDDMRPEPHRVVVARIHRHPCGAPCLSARRSRAAGRFPPARRRADDHQPGRRILAEATEEGLADHGTGRPAGRRSFEASTSVAWREPPGPARSPPADRAVRIPPVARTGPVT